MAEAAHGALREELTMTQEETGNGERRRYLAARRRVHELRAFYQHLMIYLLVNAVLATWNLLTDPDSLWFIYPLGGWGVGLTIHALTTFGTGSFLGADWERRKIEKILAAGEKRDRG